MPMTPRIRWCIRRDFPAVIAIDRQSYKYPLSIPMLDRMVHEEQSLVTIVAGDRYDVIGYCQFSLGAGVVGLERMAVAPHCRRLGVGRCLLERVMRKVRHTRRLRATAFVDEELMDALLFLRACGWQARKLWPPFEPVDGPLGIVEMQWRDPCHEGLDVIRRILAGNARVLT